MIDIRQLYKKEIKERNSYYEECLKGYYIGINDIAERYFYCFDEFMECSTGTYIKIAEICKTYNINCVYDIGCCYPFQHKIFDYYGIKYVGVEISSYISLPDVPILYGEYPFSINVPDRKHTAAISNLCISYQAHGQDVYRQLNNDFDYFFGYICEKEQELFRKTFKGVCEIGKKIYP